MSGATPPGPADPIRKPTETKDQTLPVAPGQAQGVTGASPGGPNPAAAAAAAGAGAAIKIDPPKDADKATDGNPLFSITTEPKMPVINATASVVGIITGADPTPTTEFEWTATVSFDSKNCPHGVATQKFKSYYKKGDTRTIAPITSKGKVTGGKIVVNFDKIRGGALTISVTAKVGATTLTGETKGWRIQGTNPSKGDVGKALPDDTHRKIACAESSMQQFFPAPDEGNAAYPYFSGDGNLGIGICQLTDPPAEDDQVWNWRETVKAGVHLYNQKKAGAKAYPGLVAKSAKFLALEKAYNDNLKKAATPAPGAGPTGTAGPAPTPSPAVPATPAPGASPTPAAAAPPAAVKVTVPEFNAEQLEDDTIRGFNGWGGDDGFILSPKQLHEFRIQLDASGNLVVVGDPKTGTVSAQWERVPVADRPGSGDPSYIDDVKNRDPNTCARIKK